MSQQFMVRFVWSLFSVLIELHIFRIADFLEHGNERPRNTRGGGGGSADELNYC
jgi:hypothetical protein